MAKEAELFKEMHAFSVPEIEAQPIQVEMLISLTEGSDT